MALADKTLTPSGTFVGAGGHSFDSAQYAEDLHDAVAAAEADIAALEAAPGVYVDDVTITGTGTEEDPFVAAAPAFSGAAVYLAGTVAVAPQNTEMVLSYDTEAYDVGGYWAVGAPTRLVAPRDGYYLVSAGISFAGASDSSSRQIRIRKNAGGSSSGGSAVALTSGAPIPTAAFTSMRTSGVVYLEEDDYVEVFVLQNASASLANCTVAAQMAFQISFLGT